ncbi:MAG: FAD-dependent tricarballylate dehydrogenase TcuA [Pseudomonadales bacterium]|nr:FAD-dependent tricarballylate dehydrogenase TcuA [Pseudomonadales bacterium]
MGTQSNKAIEDSVDERTEILVIGGGHAGLCAAISAREAGRSVLLLDAASESMRGGNSRHTRNLRAMHTEPTATLTDRYDEEEYWQDILRVTNGQTNEELTRLVIRESFELLHWLSSRGVRFQPSLRGTLSLDRTNAFFLSGGCALVNALYRYAMQIGVVMHYEKEIAHIELSGTSFRWAETKTGETFHADAAVLACGGFQANTDWMVEAWGDAALNFLIRGTPLNRGYVLRDLMQQDVLTIGDPRQCHAVAIDARAPKFDGGIVSRLDSVPFGIVVNREAKRFYDEGEDFWPKRYAIWGRLVAAQPEQIAYSIIDHKVQDLFMPSVYPAITADSIPELATKLDIDPQALSDTISQFNAATDQGTCDHTVLDGRRTTGLLPDKTNWAQTLDRGPYHAYPLRPGITFTYLGLKVDQQARVQMNETTFAPNLYAAGEIMAGNILGEGYCAGTGMTVGGVFGRIAGTSAAAGLQT